MLYVMPVSLGVVTVMVPVGEEQVGCVIEIVGASGLGETDTFRVLGELAPQLLLAVNEMVPPVCPAVVVMALVEELPLHPFGKVQEYEVAPVTALML